MKRVGTRTHQTRKSAAVRQRERDIRGVERHAMVVFVRATPGSLNQKVAALKAEILAGRIHGKLVNRMTVSRWLQLPEEDVELGPIAFRDKSRPGRPRKAFSPAAEEKVQRHLTTQTAPSIAELTRAAERAYDDEAAAAAAKGETVEGRRPTYARVHLRAEEQDLAEKAAGRHGSRAAEFDALPRSVVPAERAHEVWTADEFDAPVLVKFRARQTREVVALKPRIAFAIDNATRVLPSYLVTNMTKKGYPGTCDGDDFRAMLMNAAIPELAERYAPASAAYAGYLPREIRWDRAAIHNAARTMLRDSGVIVPDLEGANPPARGMVEVAVKTLGPLLWDIKGYDPTWTVTEALREHPKAARTKAAATTKRILTNINLDIDELLTLDEFIEEFTLCVRRYHRMPLETENRATREELYFERFYEERCLSGRNVFLGLEKQACTVGKYLTHRRKTFPVIFGGTRLRAGSLATFAPDPLLRGILTEEFGGGVVFVPASQEAAKETLATDVTRARRATARALSDAAGEVRSEMQRQALGDEGAARANANLRARVGPSAVEKRAQAKATAQGSAKPQVPAPASPKPAMSGSLRTSQPKDPGPSSPPATKPGASNSASEPSTPRRPAGPRHPAALPRKPFDPVRAIRLVV